MKILQMLQIVVPLIQKVIQIVIYYLAEVSPLTLICKILIVKVLVVLTFFLKMRLIDIQPKHH